VTVLEPRLAVVPFALLVFGAAEAWFLRRKARAAIAATSPTKKFSQYVKRHIPKTAEPQYHLAQRELHLART
jgi:hypothetical protein